MSAIRSVLLYSLIGFVFANAYGQRTFAADVSPVENLKTGIAIMAEAKPPQASHKAGVDQGLTDAVRVFLAEYTDIQYAARLILSKYWQDATPEQQDRFVAAFNNLVTKKIAVLASDIEFESVRIAPFLGDLEDTPLSIQATFRNADDLVINFILVTHERDGHWLIFDVVAEGVSYVKTFRNQVNGEVTDIGLEAMINRFEERSTEP